MNLQDMVYLILRKTVILSLKEQMNRKKGKQLISNKLISKY
jgi:hypothetical protein